MPIEKLDQEICIGCGICFNCCPHDVFRLEHETRKSTIRYPEDCVACWACESFCPVDAIYVSPGRGRGELPDAY